MRYTAESGTDRLGNPNQGYSSEESGSESPPVIPNQAKNRRAQAGPFCPFVTPSSRPDFVFVMVVGYTPRVNNIMAMNRIASDPMRNVCVRNT